MLFIQTDTCQLILLLFIFLLCFCLENIFLIAAAKKVLKLSINGRPGVESWGGGLILNYIWSNGDTLWSNSATLLTILIN